MVGAGVVAGLDEAANVDVLWIGSIAGDEDRLDVVGALCVVGRDAGASVVVCRAVVCAAVVAGDGPKLGHNNTGSSITANDTESTNHIQAIFISSNRANP
jgi:hypothetical protein